MTQVSGKAALAGAPDDTAAAREARLPSAPILTAAQAAELLHRCDRAAHSLTIMSKEPHNQGDYAAHLVSKAQGVRLVISYIEEALRDA